MPEEIGNNALQRQIDALGERMDKGFNEIKELMRGYEERVRGLENREAGCQPVITSRLDAAWREIDSHEAQIKALTETVQALRSSNRIIAWIGGVAGVALISWFFSQILGLISK